MGVRGVGAGGDSSGYLCAAAGIVVVCRRQNFLDQDERVVPVDAVFVTNLCHINGLARISARVVGI